MRTASTNNLKRWAGVCALALSTLCAAAQTAPRQTGTVKAVNADGITLTTAAGQDYTVTVSAASKVLTVAPGAKDLSSAAPGQLSDIATGDRVLVTGSAGDSGTTLNAQRVIVMKQTAIADAHAAEEAAWAAGVGGIVKTVDPSTGTITISHGLRPITVTTTPATLVRRYSPDSVRAQDAVKSTVAAIRPGDQLRARGSKSEDGSSITAEEILTGSFRNYSGLITAIDPAAQTITLKDLTTKKVVVVAVTSNSDVRRLPERAAQMVAMRMKGGAAGAAGAGARPGPPAGGGGDDDRARAGRAGMDLSQMLSRLPTETLGGLKNGDAVMIVASAPAEGSNRSTAVTLLVGVEPILEASPSGQTMTLSPWSLGSDPSAGGGMAQ